MILMAGEALLLVLLGSDPAHLRYERAITAEKAGEACARLDAEVFAHAATALKDLRVFAAGQEIPYVITMSGAAQPEGETARVLNVAKIAQGVRFDLEMPNRPYTEVKLDVAAKDFVATASVSGSDALEDAHRVDLGRFSLFDMSAKRLSRDTTIALQESSFRYLHVEMRGKGMTPEAIKGVEVPPSRDAQTIFATVATTNLLVQRGDETVATFRVPARVPIERVSVALSPKSSGSFSREVRVTARAAGLAEVVDGNVMRVHEGEIAMEKMSLAANLGANLQEDATVEVAIRNGDQGALPVTSVMLQMRERHICLAAADPSASLYYGDAALVAPDYGSGLPATKQPAVALLGPERTNPRFRERSESKSIGDRYPDLGWLTLTMGIGVLGTLALRSLRSGPR